MPLCERRRFEQNYTEQTVRAETKRAQSLTAGEACKAIFQSTPG